MCMVVFVRNKKRNSRSTVDTRSTGFPHVSIYNPTYDTDNSDKTFAVYKHVNTIIYFRTIFLLRPGFHSLLDNHCRPIRYSPNATLIHQTRIIQGFVFPRRVLRFHSFGRRNSQRNIVLAWVVNRSSERSPEDLSRSILNSRRKVSYTN